MNTAKLYLAILRRVHAALKRALVALDLEIERQEIDRVCRFMDDMCD